MNPVIALATSRLGPVLGLMIGRLLPRAPSEWLADRMAAWAAAQPTHGVVRAVRANQAVARELPYRDPSLSEAVVQVFRNAAHGYLTFFRSLARGRTSLGASCEVDPVLIENCRQVMAAGRGVFLAGPHMGNFDLALVALQQHELNPLVLSYRNPHGSYVIDNAIRQRYGVELTPISMRSLRDAVGRLAGGGCVLTLVDRPDSRGRTLDFFGRPANMPFGHARLALRSGSVLQIGAALQIEEGRYRIEAGGLIDPLEIQGTTRSERELTLAQQVAWEMETFIRRRPGEWLMFLPVWPQALP
ncbi:MAG: lysophospholipid acyltransferase family protein [Anaerolineales bacterium]|nr:lysophospholipid acyltransferase family protein [Anaerolineales bacterium]